MNGTVMSYESAQILLAISVKQPVMFAKAQAAAEGDAISGICARKVAEGMTLWCPDSDTWFVTAGGAITGRCPHDSLCEPRKYVSDIPIQPDNGATSRTWRTDADRPLIRRHPNGRRSGS